jgi:Homeodomain-like domain
MKTVISPAERARILDLYLERKSINNIAHVFKRAERTVERILLEAGLRPDDPFAEIDNDLHGEIVMNRKNPYILDDCRFQTAMRRAVANGRETPPAMDIVTDDSPPPPRTRFYPAVEYRSGGSSAAVLCMDLGEGSE